MTFEPTVYSSTFTPEDIAEIDEQFPDDSSGLITWKDLQIAIDELSKNQLNSSVTLVDKSTGNVYTANDCLLLMNVLNGTLQTEIKDTFDDDEETDAQPLIIF